MASMTGFGKGAAHNPTFEISCEIRSVNSRFFDLILRLPPEISGFEKLIREQIKKGVSRGKVTLYVTVSQNKEATEDLLIHTDKFRKAYKSLEALKTALDLKQDISIEHLLSFPDILKPDFSALPEDELLRLLNSALAEALKNFNQMRAEEGKKLLEDIRQRMETITGLKREIDALSKGNVKKEFDKLYKNVLQLIGEKKLDRERLEEEIAIISDRVDITEECVRLESHFELLNNTLNQEKEAGKKITFILQEILREVNTINSKNSVVEIQHRVIRIKEELEKIREQAQNLE